MISTLKLKTKARSVFAPLLNVIIVGGTLSASAWVVASTYMAIQKRRMAAQVYRQLENGTMPKISRSPLIGDMLYRNDLHDKITELFFPRAQSEAQLPTAEEGRGFGLIVGPTGTGKTTLVRTACAELPGGVLYYNVRETKDFCTELAETVGMKIAPSNVFDLLLGYFQSDDFVYYHLPQKQDQGVSRIFKVLSEAAVKYQKKF